MEFEIIEPKRDPNFFIITLDSLVNKNIINKKKLNEEINNLDNNYVYRKHKIGTIEIITYDDVLIKNTWQESNFGYISILYPWFSFGVSCRPGHKYQSVSEELYLSLFDY